MGSALVYVVVVALVAAVVYLGVALLFGRGEELAPMPPGSTPTRLPAQDLSGADVRGLRFQQTLRGYKVSEVDWALERLAGEVDVLRARLERAEGRAGDGRAGTGEVPAPTRHPGGAGPDRSGPDPIDPAPTDPRITPATASDRRTETRTESHHGHQ